MFSQLFQPFGYLRIRHPEKWKTDWLLPLFITLPLAVLLGFLQPKINIYGDKGFIQTATQFIQTLPGFYIAALAAIVTFSNDRMDQVMPDPAPTFEESSRGKLNDVPLTRRRFLSMMFAFLTAESFLVVILGVLATTLAPSIRELITGHCRTIAAFVLLFSYCFAMVQMSVVTFWGLFYLGIRIHKATD